MQLKEKTTGEKTLSKSASKKLAKEQAITVMAVGGRMLLLPPVGLRTHITNEYTDVRARGVHTKLAEKLIMEKGVDYE